MSAFPIHVWTIILGLRDFGWISERTNSWDAIGTTSYGLVYALIESIIFFPFVVILGYFISGQWEEKKRVVVMSSIVITISLWAMFNQFYFLQEIKIPEFVMNFFVNLQRPLLTLYLIAFVFTLFSFLIPTFLILYSTKFELIVQIFIERLSLLMIFYLIIDILALMIILIRNL